MTNGVCAIICVIAVVLHAFCTLFAGHNHIVSRGCTFLTEQRRRWRSLRRRPGTVGRVWWLLGSWGRVLAQRLLPESAVWCWVNRLMKSAMWRIWFGTADGFWFRRRGAGGGRPTRGLMHMEPTAQGQHTQKGGKTASLGQFRQFLETTISPCHICSGLPLLIFPLKISEIHLPIAMSPTAYPGFRFTESSLRFRSATAVICHLGSS